MFLIDLLLLIFIFLQTQTEPAVMDAGLVKIPNDSWSLKSGGTFTEKMDSLLFGFGYLVADPVPVVSKSLKIDFARAKFFRRGREDRAGVVDHPDAFHRRGMGREALP